MGKKFFLHKASKSLVKEVISSTDLQGEVEAAGTTETSVSYNNILCHYPEDLELKYYPRESLKTRSKRSFI
jgi:hypothetical protein